MRIQTITIIGLGLLVGGCVQRQLTVTSQPEGALVYLNQREAGRTPFTTDFTWYGKYDVVVRKEGFDTITTVRDVKAPWWQWVPFDLFAEMAPWRPTDRQTMHFDLKPRSADIPAESIVERGLTLKQQLGPATTQPSAK